MKTCLALLFSLLVISCNQKKEINSSINALHKLEEKLYSNPSAMLDSISIINKTISTEEARAYSNLLYAIAYEQKFGVFKNDSSINSAVKTFKKDGDNFNYSRALLYAAIAQYGNKNLDSVAYHKIRIAESLFKKESKIDYNLGATLYFYLGKFYRLNSNYEMAQQALKKSLEYSKSATNNTTLLNASLELFNLKLIDKKYREALNTISCFADEADLPPHIEYAFYNAMYNYYSAKKEPKIAIEYLKKTLQINSQELQIDVKNSKTYYQLAYWYKKIDMKDSSLYYAQAAVASVADSYAYDSHFYYRYLADILYENKQYEKASQLYKKAHLSFAVSFTKFSQQRSLELKAKFNFEEQEKEVFSLKREKTLILNLLLIVTASITLISLSYYFYARKSSKTISHLNQKLTVLDKKHNKCWLISNIYMSTSYILPQLIDNVYQEALRSRKVSKETFDSLNKIIDIANSSTRASITEITNSEQFIKTFGNIYNLDTFTDFEKLVYALNKKGYSYSQIANFLNSSQSSVRTIRSKILRKIEKIETENRI